MPSSSPQIHSFTSAQCHPWLQVNVRATTCVWSCLFPQVPSGPCASHGCSCVRPAGWFSSVRAIRSQESTTGCYRPQDCHLICRSCVGTGTTGTRAQNGVAHEPHSKALHATVGDLVSPCVGERGNEQISNLRSFSWRRLEPWCTS